MKGTLRGCFRLLIRLFRYPLSLKFHLSLITAAVVSSAADWLWYVDGLDTGAGQ